MSLRMSIFVALSLLLVITAPLAAQEPAEQPEVSFKATELAPGLYMIEGVGGFGGGNVGLLTGEDGVVLIDDSFPPLTETLLSAVAAITKDPVDFLINTHVHGDHTGGNAILGRAGATILAHDNVRQRLVKEGMPAGGENRPAPKEALPVITFADQVTVHLNGHEAYVFHVAQAHTDGDAVIHFRDADVIHAGDVFFNRIFPFIDLDSGGSLDGYIAGQERILELTDDGTKIIPGHGPLGNAADLEASLTMLKAARSRIQALIDEGKSVEEVLEAGPLNDFAEMSWDFITTERMVRQVYRALAGE